VLLEMLRMYLPVPYLLHAAPYSSALVTGTGTWLPYGTVVWAVAYMVQRYTNVFWQPHAWEPARWLVLGRWKAEVGEKEGR
jgi:cytochrome P450